MQEENGEGRSLAETPTWAVGTVITLLVSLSFLSHATLKKLVKWLDRTKRKSLLSALEKIQEEYSNSNKTLLKDQVNNGVHDYCPKGHESFASYESLEQLHRFVFVLGITHVSYSFIALALALIKIYSWRTWENEAKTMAVQSLQDTSQSTSSIGLRRLSTFIFHRTSHPWSNHKILVWLLCFSRQFWSSISRADYMALRLGFITNHDLPLTYNFHNYMLRSMDEEFRDIIGSRFKKFVISENVRKSLSKWQRRLKDKQSSSYALLNTTSTTSLESLLYGMDKSNPCALPSEEGSSSGTKDICFSNLDDVSKTQRNASFPSYEDHHDHDVKYDLSPPPLS